MKKLKTSVRKSEELQGPTKTKKIAVKDFKEDFKDAKHKTELDEILDKNDNKLKQYDNLLH